MKEQTRGRNDVVLAIFLLACAIRLFAVWFWADETIGLTDQSEYLALAQNLKLHGEFSYGAPHLWGGPGLLNTAGPFQPTAARPPLFPLFIASLWWQEAPPILQVRVAQAIMGGLVAVLVYFLGLQIFGRRAALFAGFGMALAPMSATLPVAIMTETLFTFLLTLAMWLWNRNYHFGAGIVMGLATLTRAILLPVLAAIGLTAMMLRFNRRAHLKILIGAVLVIAPWAARNAVTQHAFVPVASMGWGANIFLGTYDIPFDAGNPWLIVAKDEAFVSIPRDSPSETVAEQRFMKASLERIIANPVDWAIVRIKQYPRLFLSSGYYLLPVIPVPKEVMRMVYGWGGVVFLALTACGFLLTRSHWPQAYPMALVVVVFCASQFPGVGEERYSTQVVPLMMLFAGHAMACVLRVRPSSLADVRSP